MIIVDEFTGRLMPGRQWSDGLHQAVEAKEGVQIKEENQTLATITLQNFFKLYKKICGMTGTAMTEAAEFWKIYKLDVIAIPTNRPMQRINHPDVIYRTEREKFKAIADEIERLHKWDVLELKDGTTGRRHDSARRTISRSTSSTRKRKQREVVPKSKIADVQTQGPADPGRHRLDRKERTALRACWTGAASSTRCSTPSTTSARPRSSPRPAARAP